MRIIPLDLESLYYNDSKYPRFPRFHQVLKIIPGIYSLPKYINQLIFYYMTKNIDTLNLTSAATRSIRVDLESPEYNESKYT